METARRIARRYGDVAVCLAVFFVCYLPRDRVFPPANQWVIDLEIYRAGGELVAKGINPYDYARGKAVRDEIYTFHRKTLGWGFPTSVDMWNYYASGNLPLNLWFFGLIYKINPSPTAFRAVFHVADALVGVLAFLLIRFRWGSSSRRAAFLLAVLLSLNGAFLKWGTTYPEDKGIETLLFFATLALMVPNRNSWPRLVGVAVLAAAAISFKMLGIFLVPAVLVWAYRERGRRGLIVVAAVVGGLCLAINAAYLPWMLKLWRDRMGSNTGGPIHCSIWILPYGWWPWLAKIKAPATLSLLGTAVAAVQVYRRKLSLEVFGGIVTYLFCVVYLVGGSIDRVTMGVMAIVATLGIQRPSWGLLTLALWTAAGVGIYFVGGEDTEGMLVLYASIIAFFALVTGTLKTWPFAPALPHHTSS